MHAAAPEAWLVGGALRDLLDGREPAYLDFVTTLDAQEIAKDLAATLHGSPFPLDELRKTWRIVLPQATQLREIDISTIETGLEADLRRRDFTVDALAAPINPDGTLGKIIDLFGGVEDLHARRLRMLGESALQEDPLRMLRAVRLAVELDMTVDDGTAVAVRRSAPSLNESAAERQRDELVRIFETPRSAEGVRLLDSLGLLDVMLPELGPSRGCEQPFEHHYWDVFDHLVETVASLDRMLAPYGSNRALRPGPGPASWQSGKATGWLGRLLDRTERQQERPWLAETFRRGLRRFELDEYLDSSVGGTSRRALIKLAGLLHDVSKPETKTDEPDGRVRFFGHSEQGAAKASAICQRLRFGGREAAFVSKLVEEHLRPFQLANKALPSSRALYRFFRDLGDAAPGVLILSLADAAAARGPRLQPERWRGHVAYIAYVLENGLAQRNVVTRQPRLVTGSDLIEALGLEPGPEIGRMLAAIEEAVAAGEVTSKQEAIELARGLTSPSLSRVPLRPRRGTDADETLPDFVDGEVRSPVLLDNLLATHAKTGPTRWRQWRTDSVLAGKLKLKAREMRHAPTKAEDALWQQLRRRQVAGCQFRRQHPIERFIVDFYCSQARLVVEVNGPLHDKTLEADHERQELLERLGYRVLRFTNDQVMTDLGSVLERILDAIQTPTDTSPSPWTPALSKAEGERGTEGERL